MQRDLTIFEIREILLLEEQMNLENKQYGRCHGLEEVRNGSHVRDEVLPRILSQDPDATKAILQPAENRVSFAPRPIELFKVDVQLEVVIYPLQGLSVAFRRFLRRGWSNREHCVPKEGFLRLSQANDTIPQAQSVFVGRLTGLCWL